MQIKPGTFYNMVVAVNGTNVTVLVDNTTFFSHTFAPRVDPDGWVYGINAGMIGFGSDNSRGVYDNIAIKVLPPAITLEGTEEFPNTDGIVDFAPATGAWDGSGVRYTGTSDPGAGSAVSLVDLGVGRGLEVASILEFETTLSTATTGGVVFDYYSADNFKCAVIDAVADKLVIGHYTKKSGWVTDANYALAIDAGADYVLNLSLKGTMVSASVKRAGAAGWQGMAGYVFNAVTVDGAFGLLTRNGASSFDKVTVKTDDPGFRDPDDVSFLMAASEPADPVDVTEPLTYDDLDPIIDAAINRWTSSVLFDQSMLARLEGVTVLIADLTGDALALTVDDTIIIDIVAAGQGWFVDSTPYQDSEFVPQGNDDELTANEASDAYGDVDLLTVLMHELGHVFGFNDLDPRTSSTDLMSARLEEGERILPADASAGQALSNSDDLISMDLTPDPGVAQDLLIASIKKNAWLVKYLVDGAEEDPDSDVPPSDNQDPPVPPAPVVPPGNGKKK
jgi:hypothetical protein